MQEKRKRKDWNLEPEEFEIRDPGWGPYIPNLVQSVKEELGVGDEGGNVTVQLTRRRVLEPGTHNHARRGE